MTAFTSSFEFCVENAAASCVASIASLIGYTSDLISVEQIIDVWVAMS